MRRGILASFAILALALAGPVAAQSGDNNSDRKKASRCVHVELAFAKIVSSVSGVENWCKPRNQPQAQTNVRTGPRPASAGDLGIAAKPRERRRDR